MAADIDNLTRGERTRQAILDAAESLFLTNGYHGTSMRQIAKKAGDIAVGGIYNHFPNKEEIFHALLESRSPYPAIFETLDSLEGNSAPELLTEALIQVQTVIREHMSFFGLLIIDVNEFDGQSIRGMIDQIIPSIIAFAGRLREAGGIREDINVLVLIRIFASIIIGFTITNLVAFAPDGKPMLANMAGSEFLSWEEEIINILLTGIADTKEAAS